MRGRLSALARRLRPTRPRPRPRILMYHRVAVLKRDPWGLAVTPTHFAEQLDVLRRCRTSFALDEFVALLNANTLPGDAVAVNFDDGYADKLHKARPLLAAGIPATLFVASAAIGSPDAFWWDELAHLILAARNQSTTISSFRAGFSSSGLVRPNLPTMMCPGARGLIPTPFVNASMSRSGAR